MAMSTAYLTDMFQERSWAKDTVLVLGASIIIALFGPVALPLPFTPVPIAFQAHVILFLAVLLGSKRGSLATLAFLGQGAIGLPVFAGCKGGILHLAGPTGGYLFGYVLAAYVTGYLIERSKERTVKSTLFAICMGNLAIYLAGLPWLSMYVGVNKAFFLGMLPFLGGDVVKIILSLRLLRSLRN